ncbi:universal stress protein [Halomicrococcus sp. NG-SE-24]|uniref:universal stress protein n=1 Tax=Halomicrococcus sp. NG-SE-24 TaxID=3436928 RepID=UPI003D9811E7
MPKRILVPVSPFVPWARALATAIVDLEEPDTTELILLHVFTEEEKQAALADTDLGDNSDITRLTNSQSNIAAAQDILTEAGFTITTRGTVSDNLGEAILDATEAVDVDCLYLFSRRRSSAGKAVFGSTIQHILLNATVPVLTIPPTAVSFTSANNP